MLIVLAQTSWFLKNYYYLFYFILKSLCTSNIQRSWNFRSANNSPSSKGEKKKVIFFSLLEFFSFLPTHPTSISHFLRKPFSWRQRESFPTHFPQPPQTHAHPENNLAPRTSVVIYSTLPIKICLQFPEAFGRPAVKVAFIPAQTSHPPGTLGGGRPGF